MKSGRRFSDWPASEQAKGRGGRRLQARWSRLPTLLRQTSDTRKIDPAVIAAARELRLRQDEEVLAARARCAAFSVAQPLATNSRERRSALSGAGAILRRERLRLHLQRQTGSIVATSLSSAKKGFDAQDLGQGKRNGGGLVHRRNRLELMLRVAAAFLALAGDAAADASELPRVARTDESRSNAYMFHILYKK